MVAYAFLYFLLTLTSCIGAGHLLWILILRRLSSDALRCTCPSSIELGIIGLLVVGIVAALLNFIFPISHLVSTTLICVCLTAGIFNFIVAPKHMLPALLISLSVVLLFSFWGAKFILSYDAGLYHLQAISWMKNEPVVIGLANLHDRFGFNSLMLSALTVFWLPIYEVKGLLLANYLPAILTVLILFNHALKIPKHGHLNLTASTLFALFCMAILTAMPSLVLSNTTSTDLAPNAYSFLSAFIFLRAIENNKESEEGVFRNHIILWVISVFAILTKLSAVTPGLLALVYSLSHSKVLGAIAIRRTAYFMVSIVAIWLLRNFFLSGCLIYPVGFTCADSNLVQWAVGSEGAETTQSAIRWWARAPSTNILLEGSNQLWLEDWKNISNRGVQLTRIVQGIMGLPLVVLLYFLLVFVNQRKASRRSRTNTCGLASGFAWVFFAEITGLVFGFLTVPDPRFWWGPLITLLILPPVMMLTFIFVKNRISVSLSSASIVILCLTGIFWGYALLLDPAEELFSSQVKIQSTIIPTIESEEIHVNGLSVHVPVSNDKCWLAPRPCSPVTHPELRLDYFGRHLVFSIVKK